MVVVVVVGMAVLRAAFTFAVHVTLGFELSFRQVSHGHDAARQRRAAALVPRIPLPHVSDEQVAEFFGRDLPVQIHVGVGPNLRQSLDAAFTA